MTDEKIIERETITTDTVEPHEAIDKTLVSGSAPHGDEAAGGALVGAVGGAAVGAVGGAAVGAVVGGPVGAVVGGAIGAASGATVGAIDTRKKDEVVVTHEKLSS